MLMLANDYICHLSSVVGKQLPKIKLRLGPELHHKILDQYRKNSPQYTAVEVAPTM